MNSRGIQDYTRLTKDYDSTRYINPDDVFIDSLRTDRFRKLLKVNKNMNIVDIGTGTGSGILIFAKGVKNITGLDGTKAMLEAAHRKIMDNNVKNAQLVHSNALSTPFEANQFDAVISLNFIHLFKPINRQRWFIKEMERVVKRSGSVVIEVDNILYCKELGNRYIDIPKLSKNMKVKKIVGVSLPITKRLFKINKTLAKMYSKLAEIFPFKYFAHRWVVRFEKS